MGNVVNSSSAVKSFSIKESTYASLYDLDELLEM